MIAAAVMAGAMAFAPAPKPIFLTCTVQADDVAFGAFEGAAKTATGQITLTCSGTGSSFYTVSLSDGSSRTFRSRFMSQGPSRLTYNLYQDPSFNQVWGDGTQGSRTVSGAIILVLGNFISRMSVYGRVDTQLTPLPGVYTDQIVVTVSY
jgi:spore coat protein U-like protein